MIDDRLSVSLSNMGYHRVNSNAQGIYLFCHAGESDLIIVSVIHADNGDEYTAEQYKHILDQIKMNFCYRYQQRIHLLSLIITRFPDRVKHLCSVTLEDSHWIIDESLGRLMIYETQSNEFAWLKNQIETILEEDKSHYQGQQQGQYQNQSQGPYRGSYQGMPHRRNGRRAVNTVPITLFNSIIIAVNVIAFLIFQYSGAYGGKNGMYLKGALSWYFITEGKEYYRILTAMFMHADWSHLFNNMFVLLFIGSILERIVGKYKYLFIYFGAGIIAGIASISYNMWKDQADFPFGHTTFSVGASGAIFGVVGALLYIVLINRGRLKEISASQIILFVILSLYSGIVNSRIDQAAHLGGFFAGILMAVILYRVPFKNKKQNGYGEA